MAAPTVGAVMADILPYLGVARNFPEEEVRGKTVIMGDYADHSPAEAQKALQDMFLTARIVGNGETVTGQIPAAGQSVPGGSEVILYCGEIPERQNVKFPDFSGMNRGKAEETAGKLGLYVLVSGNDELSASVVVTSQSIPTGQEVPMGTTIELKFTDTSARD